MKKKITLQNGFRCTVDDARFDDMELLEDLAEVDNGNILKLPDVISKMIGAENKKKLYDTVRDKKTGIVSSVAVGDALQEIIEAMSEEDPEDSVKNS